MDRQIFQDRINITLEEYDSAITYQTSELERDISEIIGMDCIAEVIPPGRLTDYRTVRSAKSIIKVVDRRKESRQKMPKYL